MGTDLDIPATVGDIEDLRSKLSEHFKPTECDVRTQDDDVVVNMNYRGFDDFETAIEHVVDHATRLESVAGCDDVRFGVDTRGSYDPDSDDRDDRPSGYINATFTPHPIAQG